MAKVTLVYLFHLLSISSTDLPILFTCQSNGPQASFLMPSEKCSLLYNPVFWTWRMQFLERLDEYGNAFRATGPHCRPPPLFCMCKRMLSCQLRYNSTSAHHFVSQIRIDLFHKSYSVWSFSDVLYRVQIVYKLLSINTSWKYRSDGFHFSAKCCSSLKRLYGRP